MSTTIETAAAQEQQALAQSPGTGPQLPSLTPAQEIARAIIEERSLADQLPSVTATAAGVSPVDLAAIERADRLPTGAELRRLLAALGVSEEIFLGALSAVARAEAERLLAPAADDSGAAPTAAVALSAPEPGERVPRPPALARRRAKRNGQQQRTGGGQATTGEEIPVTVQIVRACLAAFFEQVHQYTRGEIVYGWEYGPRFGARADLGLLVKVYTSISGQSLRAHPIGDDAIRVLVYDRRSKRKVEAWSCRINRTGDWPKRLRRLAGEAVMRATYRPRCKRCQEQPECEVRGNPGEQFWGCPNYKQRGCQFTRDIVVAPQPVTLGQREEKGLTVGTPERQRPARPRPRPPARATAAVAAPGAAG